MGRPPYYRAKEGAAAWDRSFISVKGKYGTLVLERTTECLDPFDYSSLIAQVEPNETPDDTAWRFLSVSQNDVNGSVALVSAIYLPGVLLVLFMVRMD